VGERVPQTKRAGEGGRTGVPNCSKDRGGAKRAKHEEKKLRTFLTVGKFRGHKGGKKRGRVRPMETTRTNHHKEELQKKLPDRGQKKPIKLHVDPAIRRNQAPKSVSMGNWEDQRVPGLNEGKHSENPYRKGRRGCTS